MNFHLPRQVLDETYHPQFLHSWILECWGPFSKQIENIHRDCKQQKEHGD